MAAMCFEIGQGRTQARASSGRESDPAAVLFGSGL
jgi:hypothetical protein